MVEIMNTKYDEGIEEGMEKEREKEREKVVIRCLNMGKSVEETAVITGLSIEMIEKRKKKLGLTLTKFT